MNYNIIWMADKGKGILNLCKVLSEIEEGDKIVAIDEKLLE